MISCSDSRQKQSSDLKDYSKGTFGYDLYFLKQNDDSLVVLTNQSGGGKVIVSPKYQGKVFTSTAGGNLGLSFGWVNYKAFSSPLDSHMNAYGGENRLWLGPEGGKFSLFFKPDSPMVFQNWKTPASYDSEPWNITDESQHSVTMQKAVHLINYRGTAIDGMINRTVTILDSNEIGSLAGVAINGSARAVGYKTVNSIENTGKNEWTEETGMPCLWLLDMFKPSESTVIIVPFKNLSGKSFDSIATTDYFGKIPPARLKHTDDMLFFKADGKMRGKLGIKPMWAKPLAASYDPQLKTFTVIMFDLDPAGKYLNQEWNTHKPPFSGDAVNTYNDGPLADGTQMGPFYEMESVSPAAFLNPGETLKHQHTVLHFTGETDDLNPIAEKLLGIRLEEVQKVFDKN
jgi:hypothetical protein